MILGKLLVYSKNYHEICVQVLYKVICVASDFFTSKFLIISDM